MTKACEFNWKRQVPQELLDGCYFDIWEEVWQAGRCAQLTMINHFECLQTGKRRNRHREQCTGQSGRVRLLRALDIGGKGRSSAGIVSSQRYSSRWDTQSKPTKMNNLKIKLIFCRMVVFWGIFKIVSKGTLKSYPWPFVRAPTWWTSITLTLWDQVLRWPKSGNKDFVLSPTTTKQTMFVRWLAWGSSKFLTHLWNIFITELCFTVGSN